MQLTKQQTILDGAGKPVGVFLPLDEYQRILEALEELEDIAAFDAAKASGEEAIPFELAFGLAAAEKG